MTTPRSCKGRICHERNSVPVPAELRLEVHNRCGSAMKAAKYLGISEVTARSILEPGGVLRVDVLERVKARLAG